VLLYENKKYKNESKVEVHRVISIRFGQGSRKAVEAKKGSLAESLRMRDA
jgi:hypothetical protein